jgi:ferritin-like metal-binding protein YciE
MRLNTFENLYIDQLKDLHSAESQLIDALPKMAQAAATPELQEAFRNHLEQTRGHAETVAQLLADIGEKTGEEKCKGMEGLLIEGQEVYEKRGEAPVKDAALIAAAQRVEHYEIAGYGTARTFALQLGYNNAVNRLQEILNDESDADELLTRIATGEGIENVAVNQEAASVVSHSSNGAHHTSHASKTEPKQSAKPEPKQGSKPESGKK